METQFRPYSMVLQIADATASGVSLKDTSGAALQCNFISVEASGRILMLIIERQFPQRV